MLGLALTAEHSLFQLFGDESSSCWYTKTLTGMNTLANLHSFS